MRECVDEGILQSYFDGELSARMAEGVASHLASCIGCAEAASELESESLLLSKALGAEFAVSVPTERLRQRVAVAIAETQAERASIVANADGSSTPMALPHRAQRPPAVPVVRRWVQSIAELFTFAPKRAFGYAGLAAVVLFAAIVGGIYQNSPAGSKDGRGLTAGSGGPVVPSILIPQATPSPKVLVSGPDYLLASTEHSRKSPHPIPNRPKESAHVRLLPGERSYLKTIATLDANIKSDSNRQMKPSLQVEYERNLAMVDQAIAATRSAAKVNPSDPDAAEFMFAAYQSKIDLLNQVADSRLSNRQH